MGLIFTKLWSLFGNEGKFLLRSFHALDYLPHTQILCVIVCHVLPHIWYIFPVSIVRFFYFLFFSQQLNRVVFHKYTFKQYEETFNFIVVFLLVCKTVSRYLLFNVAYKKKNDLKFTGPYLRHTRHIIDCKI